MARSIWKFGVRVSDDPQELFLPKGARVVHVACQSSIDVVNFWADVEETFSRQSRWFQVFGTGHAVPHDAQYLGTAVPIPDLVWHLFEVEAPVNGS